MVGDFANFQRKESLTFLEFFSPIQSMISLEKFTDKCGRKGIFVILNRLPPWNICIKIIKMQFHQWLWTLIPQIFDIYF